MSDSPVRPLARLLPPVAVAVACGAAALVGAADAVALALVLIVGFPHGAADLGNLRRLRRRGARVSVALGLYLAAMAATGLLWYLAPAVALAAFVAISVLHFGQDEATALGLRGRRQYAYAAAFGAFALGAPLSWRGNDLGAVVAAMTGGAGAADLAWVTYGSAAAGVACVTYAAYRFSRKGTTSAHKRMDWGAELILLALLAASAAVLAPLPAFAVFFVGVHSATSLVNQVRWRGWGLSRDSVGRFLREGAPYAAAAVVLIVVGVLWLRGGGDTHLLAPSVLAAFFVLVSVVTTPHAAVVAWMSRRAAREG